MALKFPFLDEVNKASYHEMLTGGHKHVGHKNILARYRQMLHRAVRFQLDDDFVRLVCEMSHQKDRLDLWSILARLPYDTLWIEFDMHEKVRTWERMGTLREPFDPAEVSPVGAYLITKDLDSETRWVATEFIHFDGMLPMPQSCDFVFDPNGSALTPVTGSTLWRELTLSRRPGFPKADMVIQTEASDGPVTLFRPDGEVWTMDIECAVIGMLDLKEEIYPDGRRVTVPGLPDWVMHKVGLTANPMWTHRMGPEAEALQKLLIADASERSGALRWLITALAMINDLPKTVREVKARPGRAQTRAGPVKYMDYRTVTIACPKAPQLRWARRELDRVATHASRAWHTVRGHWRCVEYGRRILCRHEPTEVVGDYALCTRCERLIKWVEFPNGRGDPRLGIVEHDYEVRARK